MKRAPFKDGDIVAYMDNENEIVILSTVMSQQGDTVTTVNAYGEVYDYDQSRLIKANIPLIGADSLVVITKKLEAIIELLEVRVGAL